MIYSTLITTPANTSADDPLWTEIKLTKGIIHKVELEFPVGNQFLHRVQLTREGAFIFPTNPQGFFTSEGGIISYREFVPIPDEPLSIWARTWNLDETYEHSVLIRLGVLRRKILAPWTMTWRERISEEEAG